MVALGVILAGGSILMFAIKAGSVTVLLADGFTDANGTALAAHARSRLRVPSL